MGPQRARRRWTKLQMSLGPLSKTSCWGGAGRQTGAGGRREAAPSPLIPTLGLPPSGLILLCIGLGPRPALSVVCVRLEQGGAEQHIALACGDLGQCPGRSEATPCPFSVPRGFLERRGYWLGDPRQARLLTPRSGWLRVWLALWASRDHAGWHLSQPPELQGQFHCGQLDGSAPRSSYGRNPRARCLW